MDKNSFIDHYNKLKSINKGEKPLYRDFLQFCGINKRKLDVIFGRDAYSKLQELCGDTPNKLIIEKTPISQILDQYGKLVRQNSALPVIADWVQAGFKPTIDGICKVNNMKWSEFPTVFIKEYTGKSEWIDVVEILKANRGITNSNIKFGMFEEIVNKLHTWTPDRKRVIEEGYKIEIRNFLERYFDLEEEVGESNPDILVNRKYPVEIKRDPTQSEYDRLLGQMIRHNKAFGSAIAIVVNVSSEDRFRKFQKLFVEVHDKLGMKAELIKK